MDARVRADNDRIRSFEALLCLPVTLLVNHALADGLHIARFFQGLETELAALCAQWKAEQINL